MAVEGVDCGLGFAVVGHLDKTEAFAAASIAVVNDLGGNYLPVLSKQLLEF